MRRPAMSNCRNKTRIIYEIQKVNGSAEALLRVESSKYA
ncbi:MAG: hypothetical protein JWQ21_2525 [Herminiimonas sp.]|nr:hypothetical protein [Herminiimonas sp.]